MFIVIGIMVAGVLTGCLLRGKRLGWIHKVTTALVWLLLFLLGVEVGGNRDVVTGLHTLGWEALVITAGAVAGSTVFAWVLWRFISGRQRKTSRK
jgi:uncharacterized membrane protein YbjE (DUF340 family)